MDLRHTYLGFHRLNLGIKALLRSLKAIGIVRALMGEDYRSDQEIGKDG